LSDPFPSKTGLFCQTFSRRDAATLCGFVAPTCPNLLQTTGLFCALGPRQVWCCQSERGWSATPRLLIETGHTMRCPLRDPGSHRGSSNLIDLRHGFDRHPLGAEPNTVRTEPGSGGRLRLHDVCPSGTLACCQKTHGSHDHHPRGPWCSSAKMSYDAPGMGAISS
jgi:hypothetical protein